MFQLCSYDEYKTRNIIEKSGKIDELVPKGLGIVTEDNMHNALTLDEQVKSYTTVWPEFFKAGEKAENVFYAGLNGRGEHLVLITEGEESKEVRLSKTELKPRFFIGRVVTDSKKKKGYDVYAKYPAGKEIEDIDDMQLEDKTFIYIKKAI